MNTSLSTKIFNELINGRIINSQIFGHDDMPAENPLFTEIMLHKDNYIQHFEHCGKHLFVAPHYAMLQEENNVKTDITIKVCVLLLIMAKYLNVKGMRAELLLDANGGMSDSDLDDAEKNEECASVELMKKADIKGTLASAVNKLLVERGIMVKKSISKEYVLSQSGAAFFQQIFDNYKSH